MKDNVKKLAATLFPLEGMSGRVFQFRVLRIAERIPEDDLRPRRLQLWADYLWKHVLKCAVYPTTAKDGSPAFLIPEGNKPSGSFTIRDVPDHEYRIDVSDETREVRVKDAKAEERELICRMLERAFSDRLKSMRDVFWRAEWTLYFYQQPENVNQPSDVMNAYRGYKFGVVIAEDKLWFAVDVRTRYIGRTSLANCSESEREGVLRKHLGSGLSFKKRAYFIRDNGHVKIPCKYAGDSGNTIDKQIIKETHETVFQYYRRTYPSVPVSLRDKAVFVQDGPERTAIAAPESRLFPVFTSEYEGVKDCSVQPQMTPKERVDSIGLFLNRLSDVQYEDARLTIGRDLLVKDRTVFLPPRLEFGKDTILSPFPGETPSRASGEFDDGIGIFGSRKMTTLCQMGPQHNETLPSIVLLYPNTIGRTVREEFLRELGREVQLQSRQKANVAKQVEYQTGTGKRMGTSLIQLAANEKATNTRFLALIILWRGLRKDVHPTLKEKLGSTFSQCVSEMTVEQICHKTDPRRAQSKLRNLVLGVLTEAGVKPWVLADALHADLYIGIDTLYGRVCYHFLYGTGGRLIDTEFGHCIERGRSREAVKRPELQRILIEKIKAVVSGHYPVRSIVIHRDGRWWPVEEAALKSALDQLKAEKVIPLDVRCAVLEIHKTHKPVRLFTKTEDPPHFRNPLPGTYLIFDPEQVLLTTTGRPGAWDAPGGRTARTLHLKLVHSVGVFNVVELAEDVYRLTHLNWSAPDIEINLPVTIRWPDEALRDALPPQREEYEDAEEEIEETDDEFKYAEEP